MSNKPIKSFLSAGIVLIIGMLVMFGFIVFYPIIISTNTNCDHGTFTASCGVLSQVINH